MTELARIQYEIRLGREADIAPLQAFVDAHWKKGHAFVTHTELLRWQHWDPVSDRLNFVLGFDSRTGEILGILGFIPTGQFDSALAPLRQLWLALWKVRNPRETPGLGLELARFLDRTIDPTAIGAAAISRMAMPIYRMLGYTMDKARQFYLVNRTVSPTDFRLLANLDGVFAHPAARPDRDKSLEEVMTEERLSALAAELDPIFRNLRPRKTVAYCRNRYLRHPIYAYRLHAIVDGGKRVGLVVSRLAEANGAAALRIVDVLGEPAVIGGLGAEFQSLLEESGAEYADLICAGCDEAVLASSGFLLREEGESASGIVVPTYFEPFEQRNVDLDFAYRTRDGRPISFFKGDGDQDRPSV